MRFPGMYMREKTKKKHKGKKKGEKRTRVKRTV